MKREHEDTESAQEGIATRKPSALNNDAADPRPSVDDEFQPINIIGEPLSATIIRERRERPW